ncbi:Uncharacterised protein [Achromobacter xylosoxidans]|nr:Uncharacterised protein [Achromobacter xylosoxidans]
MIAAIAHLGGYDVKNDKVKTLVYACLVANSAKDILKDVGVAVGNKLALKFDAYTTNTIGNVARDTFTPK